VSGGLRALIVRLRLLLARRPIDDESAEELRQHLELLSARNRQQGMSAGVAEAMAQRQLGNVSLVREDIYWMNRIRWWDTLQQDVRYASRVLWRAKAFTVAAVGTLALGIAGTTVMFTLVHGVLLRPLPVHEQDRLILAWREGSTSAAAEYPFGDIEIEAVARASRLLESAAGVTRTGVSRSVVTDRGMSTYANVGLVTGGFFEVLGAGALVGRTLATADDNEGAEPVVVISHGYWQRRYGAAPDIIGHRTAIGEQPFTIAGVMPPDLDYPYGVDIWRLTSSVPAGGPFGDAARREVNLIGRLRPGVTVEQAAGELVSLNQQLTAGTPNQRILRGFVPVVRPFTDVVIGDVRVTLIALFGAVGLVLLIASANVANLLLMRGEGRRSELALRMALGAGRGRIVRQVFAESLLLSVMAGIAGSVLAWAGLPALLTVMPDGFPRLESIRIDTMVGLFSIAVVFVTAMLAGIAPALFSVRGDLVSPLRAGSPAIAGRSSTRGRQTLAVAQVALAVTVLAAAGLLIRSILNLQAIDLGLPAERLVLVNLHMPQASYGDRDRRAQFLDHAIAQLEAVPTVAAVTPVNVPPFTDRGWDVPRVTAEGQSADQAAANPSLNLESIHPNYFATIEVPIVRGRTFTPADRDGTGPVAIVSEDAATRLWPLQDPIGKRLKMGAVDSQGRWLEVVGVAGQTRYRTVTTSRPTLYLPAAQFQMTATMLIVRTTARLELLMSVARDRFHAVDPNVQVMAMAPFSEFLDRPLARPRFNALLLGVFAVAALLLSALGLYGLMSAYVRQRDREIAVRLALGATSAAVRRLVLAEAVRLAGLGALLGAGAAMIATRFLRGMLFEIHPLDPGTIVGAAVLLVGAAALASYAPVRRAARADVMTVLRSE
jgi:putative ABC transport system permease protein